MGQGEGGRLPCTSISFTGTITLMKYKALTIKVHHILKYSCFAILTLIRTLSASLLFMVYSNSFPFFWNIFFCVFRKRVVCPVPPAKTQFSFIRTTSTELSEKIILDTYITDLCFSQSPSSVYLKLF